MYSVYFWYTDKDKCSLERDLSNLDPIDVETTRIEFIQLAHEDRIVALSTYSLAALRGEDTVGMFFAHRNPVITLGQPTE